MEIREKKLWTEGGRGWALAIVLSIPDGKGWGLENACPSRDPEACREQEDNEREYSKGARLPLGLEEQCRKRLEEETVRG